jgi:predicted RNA-binding Zn-ribbon protein involved in translation (DUF1610 family)
MPECADCGTTLDVQDEGPLFYCPDCDAAIGIEQRDQIVEDDDVE